MHLAGRGVSQEEASKLSISGLAPTVISTKNLKFLKVDSWNSCRQTPRVFSRRNGTGVLLHLCSLSGIHRPNTPAVYHVEPTDTA